MAWSVEGTEEFQQWFEHELTDAERISVAAKIDLLEEKGPSLGRPHADTLYGSTIPNLKELIIQHAGDPYRVLFVFDPRRTAILLLGGEKTGRGKAWYKENIPKAEKIYGQYLKEIVKEGLISNAEKLDTDKERDNESGGPGKGPRSRHAGPPRNRDQ